jgi:arylsulfatase A
MKHPLHAIALCLPLFAPLAAQPAGAVEKPNIVIIMADDLGWRDLHCYGNEQVDTPNLDRLAKEGMRFTNAYAAAAVCTPTRAAMMTGLSPARLQITNHAPGHPDGFSLEGSNLREAESLRHLDLSYVTIAERLKQAGYATAHIGKWHLSFVNRKEKDAEVRETGLRPEAQGFDLNIGGCSQGGPPSYFAPYRIPTISEKAKGEFLPERLADEAIAFVSQKREEPFFLNWWPHSVHYPMEAEEAMIAKYRERKAIKDPVYAAMIEAMDRSIGRFLDHLDATGQAKNTLVIFNSDNGGYNGDNRPLRGLKGMIYEGGTRIPWIVRWPGVVQPGTLCDTPVISMDCFPTLLEAAGVPLDEGLKLDGLSLLPLLKQSGSFERESIYFHCPNYAFHKQNRLASAIRSKNFKLIKNYDDESLELYDLSQDIGEKTNLASKFPDIANRMKNELESWLEDSGAKLPSRTSK